MRGQQAAQARAWRPAGRPNRVRVSARRTRRQAAAERRAAPHASQTTDAQHRCGSGQPSGPQRACRLSPTLKPHAALILRAHSGPQTRARRAEARLPERPTPPERSFQAAGALPAHRQHRRCRHSRPAATAAQRRQGHAPPWRACHRSGCAGRASAASSRSCASQAASPFLLEERRVSTRHAGARRLGACAPAASHTGKERLIKGGESLLRAAPCVAGGAPSCIE